MKLAPEHDRAACALRRLDDRAAVGQRAQVVNGRTGLAGQREANRIGAGGEHDRAELPCRSVIEGERASGEIERGHLTAPHELHPSLLVVGARVQGKPRLRTVPAR